MSIERVDTEELKRFFVERAEGGNDSRIYRHLWRMIFPNEFPPWLSEELRSLQAGPYARPGLLTGELCPICGSPFYLAPDAFGKEVCKGGHTPEEEETPLESFFE